MTYWTRLWSAASQSVPNAPALRESTRDYFWVGTISGLAQNRQNFVLANISYVYVCVYAEQILSTLYLIHVFRGFRG